MNYQRSSVYWHRGSGIGRGRPSLLVCGRKFCSRCGHWRHACDFRPDPRNTRTGLRSRCTTCERVKSRERHAQLTEEQRQLIREYQRIWTEVQRRRANIPPRDWPNRRSVIDRVERVLLDREPIVRELRMRNGELSSLARASGVPERTIGRILSGESRHVRIDVADKLAVAMGVPLALLYVEQWAAA